jgi:hypothetical protein
MNISDAEATFDYQRLARFLGRPIPATKEIPRFKHNRCSVDGVLRGPWSSATDRAKIRVTDECDSLLRAHGMHHLLKPFTCSPDMKVSEMEMVLGSGLGATGTRSVAAAVDALGIPTCHKFDKYVELLNLTRNDPTDVGIFAQFGPRAFFDTPMATLWPRLACAFPNYKIVHTTRADYHRNYDEAYCAQERKWKTGHVLCMNQNFTARTPSTRHLLDGVAIPIHHRSTEPAWPHRHRENMHPTHWLIYAQVTSSMATRNGPSAAAWNTARPARSSKIRGPPSRRTSSPCRV